MPFIFREATPADLTALIDLHVTTWNATYPEHEPKPTHAIRERQWRQTFATTDGRWFCYVIEGTGGELIGFVKGKSYDHSDLPDFDAELNKIFVLKQYHRQGLGRRLVGHLVRRFLSQGATAIVLFAEASNTVACRFYEALGADRLYAANGEFHGGYGWRDLARLADICPIE